MALYSVQFYAVWWVHNHSVLLAALLAGVMARRILKYHAEAIQAHMREAQMGGGVQLVQMDSEEARRMEDAMKKWAFENMPVPPEGRGH